MTRSRKGRILVYTNSIGGKPIDPTNLADGTVIVYDQTNDVYHYVDLTTVFALIDHTHSQYLTAITKAMVEGVLTGNITTHVHNQYLTAISKAMVEAVLTGTITSHNHNGTYAPVVHNHDADYSPIGHDHAGVYAPATHSHTEYLTGITKAMVEAVLTGTITSHNHSGVYALVAHNHDGVYEPVITKNTAFNKNFGTTVGTVAEGNHTHSQYLQSITKAMVEAVLTGTITSHNHSGVYSPATHAHDDRYYTETEVDDLLAGKSDSGHNHSGVYEPAFTKNTAFNKNFGTTVGTVCQGNDARLSDSRTPTAHTHDDRYYTETEVDTLLSGKAASSHTHDDRYYTESEITTLLAGKSDSGHNHSGVYEPAFTKNTAFNKNFGTAVGTVCQGNDARLSDSRTPKAHTHDDRYYTESEVDTLLAGKSATSHNHDTTYLGISAKAADSDKLDGLDSTAFATAGHNHSGVYEPAFTKNNAFNKNFGSAAGTVCQGNDSRLSDARIASDVYAWAKASTKPSYSFSEIGSKPTSIAGYGITDAAVSFGTRANTATTTTAFIDLLTSWGMFNYGHAFCKFSWSYAGNADLTDTGYGTIETAGAVCKTWQNGDGTKMVRLICPNAGAGQYQELIYNDQGAGYSPGWRKVLNDKTFTAGTGAGNYCAGNDSRLSDARTPTAHTHDDRYYTETEVNNLLAGKSDTSHTHSYEPAFSKNTAFNKNFGTASGTVCQGNDSRLSDARTPTAHTHDDRYYTEAEVNSLLSGKSDTSHSHSYLPLAGGTLTGKVQVPTGTRSAGMYGSYNASLIGHVWSMGTAYAIPDNGANFGTLYGMAYKHTNNATGGTMAGGHQIVFCNAGSPGTAIGLAGNVWTSGGFLKNGSSDSYLLLGGGGHKAISDFATSGHNHSGVYEPAFSKNNAFNKNFGTAAGTVCQGNDSRLSNERTPSNGSVTYAKIATDLTSRQAVSASDINWSAGGVYTKTLSAATTFTFSNLQLNKVITLVASGNFTITLPAYCKRISGEYDGSTTNYIQFHCTNNASGSEEVWYTISKQES